MLTVAFPKMSLVNLLSQLLMTNYNNVWKMLKKRINCLPTAMCFNKRFFSDWVLHQHKLKLMWYTWKFDVSQFARKVVFIVAETREAEKKTISAKDIKFFTGSNRLRLEVRFYIERKTDISKSILHTIINFHLKSISI